MISTLDLSIIIIYLFIMLVISFFLGRRETIEDFLVNKRKTKSLLLAFTAISTLFGGGSLVVLATNGFKTGISYALTFGLAVVLGWVIVAFFAPKVKRFGDKYKAYTMGDFFAVRYSKNNRFLIAALILVSYFFWLALQFVVVAGLLTIVSGWSFKISLILAGLITIIYTTLAGIKSDFYTDAIQFFVIFFALFCVLLPIALIKVGGISALGQLSSTFFHPFSFDGPLFFFAGILFGAPVMLVSMEVWQRIYAATTRREVKKVFLWSALINGLFLLVPVILGLSAAILLPNAAEETVLFNLMVTLLPTGLLGIGLAGVLATVMSTVDSMIMVGSATILKDFYKSFINPVASDIKMLRLGRLFTFCFGMLGLLMAFLIRDPTKLQIFGASTLLIFAPAVLGGFFWKRANSKASFWSVLSGFIVTIALMPFIPTVAFVPGILVGTLTFFLLSFISKHNVSENIDF